jgi:hypothetical protein
MIAVGNWTKTKESTWALRLPVHDYYTDRTSALRTSLEEKFPDARVQRSDVYPFAIRCGIVDQYEDIIMTFSNVADEAFFMLLMSDFISL